MEVIRIHKPLSLADWGNKSLRKCLLALGLTDTEIRYRKGARAITDSWTGEIKSLLEIVKRKWKSQVVKHHEANGGDVEQWKAYNILYGVIVRKLARFVKKIPEHVYYYECKICGETFRHKLRRKGDKRKKICGNLQCIKKAQREYDRRHRESRAKKVDRFCQNPDCKARIFRNRCKYCSDFCRHKHWYAGYKQRRKPIKRPERWKVKWAVMSESQKEEYRHQQADYYHTRINKETSEQKIARLKRNAEKMKAYRLKRKIEGRPILNPKANLNVWLEKQRIKYLNKPWIYETILQQQKVA